MHHLLVEYTCFVICKYMLVKNLRGLVAFLSQRHFCYDQFHSLFKIEQPNVDVVFINYLLVPLNLIDIKVSFEFYLFTMTGQSITNNCSLLSIILQRTLLFYSLASEVQKCNISY